MIKKIKKNKKEFITISVSILLCFFVLNGPKYLGAAFSYMKHYFDNVFLKEEIKSITFNSEHYINGTPGDYTVEKNAEWTGRNEATIEFNIATNLMSDNDDKDVIFVLDTSGSMVGEKYERLSKDATELITRLLTNPANTVSLISFDSDVQILAEYSKDKDTLINQINSFEIYGATDYYLALKAVDEVLDSYVVQENRDCIVVFLTDGFPTQSNSNQLPQFEIINSKYPFTKIYGVQYEMGIDVTEELKEVSHEQYSIEINTLKNILFDIALDPYRYDDFELTDYIDNEYFYVESLDDITTDMGTIALVEENGQQKVVWNVNGEKFYSGAEASLKIKVKLKDQYHDLGGYYPTNTGADVESSILGEEKNTTTTNTPVLRHGYEVLYDMNTPEGCSLENIEDGTYYAYEKVEINSAKPKCSGYEFRGWKPTSKIEYVNNDYYLMPARNLTFKATWAKMDISKDMEGNIYEVITLYETIKRQAVLDNIPSTYVTDPEGIKFSLISSDTNGKGVYTIASTENDEYPIHYFRGNVENNNVKFAGFCWKILRTTETGGTKLVYNGVPSSEGACNNTGTASQLAATSVYNNPQMFPSTSGYMYNTSIYSTSGLPYGVLTYSSQADNILYGNSITYDEATGTYTLIDPMPFIDLKDDGLPAHRYTCNNTTGTCGEVRYAYLVEGANMFYLRFTSGMTIDKFLDDLFFGTEVNKTDSNIKKAVDNWYGANMTNYTKYIENTIYCNDRTFLSDTSFEKNSTSSIKDNYLFSNANYRIGNNPTLECRQIDSFTLSEADGGTAGYGNNALKYPVGILTSDEVIYAGATQKTNTNYYLYTGQTYHLMTSFGFRHYTMSIINVYQSGSGADGGLNGGYAKNAAGVRPVISLKNNMAFGSGNGTANNPYVILAD